MLSNPNGLMATQRTTAESLRRSRADLEDKVRDLEKLNAALKIGETYLAEAQRLSHTGSFGWNVSLCSTLENSGPGINPEHLDHLFDSFFTTKDAGMGLGLPISRSIIEAHGGYIRADNESAYGGARFSFTLPAKLD
jgi:C4-dicarboxylate-specific signal transduction histidine kinase